VRADGAGHNVLLPKDSEECRTDGFMLDAAPRREGDPPVDARSPRQIGAGQGCGRPPLTALLLRRTGRACTTHAQAQPQGHISDFRSNQNQQTAPARMSCSHVRSVSAQVLSAAAVRRRARRAQLVP